MTRKFFGTDGVRGVANQHPMTVEVALALGRAVAYLFRQRGARRRIVVGKDTRQSCYMFETALSAGICSMGADCLLCGPLPTPGVAHVTASMRADAGLVISASHNPYMDNGIKVFASDGFKLPDDVEAQIEALIDSPELDQGRADPANVGRLMRIKEVSGRYIEFAKSTFPEELTLEGLRLVIDCANGAAFRVGPTIFEELGAKITALGVSPNGENINDGCGALYPQRLQEAVIKEQAHLGIALDGDADRVIIVDEKGEVVDGDAIMAVIATRMLQQKRLAKNTLVVTVMSNIGLQRCIESAGGTVVRTAVGDRYIVEAMRSGGYNLGGEQSGHLIFLDHVTTGDGIVGALQVLAAMVREGRPLSALAGVMTRFPQVLVNARVKQKIPLEQLPEVTALIAKTEQALGGDGRVLVRYSGTEPKVRVMVEGQKRDQIAAFAEEIVQAMRRSCGEG
ncbi:MAG: phosphoglucosamine mutase [Deltaproteobacteria bacterium]|nr:phosphoglucosamine mutase [Deltaproteobacteria bacterium]